MEMFKLLLISMCRGVHMSMSLITTARASAILFLKLRGCCCSEDDRARTQIDRVALLLWGVWVASNASTSAKGSTLTWKLMKGTIFFIKNTGAVRSR